MSDRAELRRPVEERVEVAVDRLPRGCRCADLDDAQRVGDGRFALFGRRSICSRRSSRRSRVARTPTTSTPPPALLFARVGRHGASSASRRA